MTSVFLPSIHSSQPPLGQSSSLQPNDEIKAVLSLLSQQPVGNIKSSRHVVNCNRLCYKSSSNLNLSNDTTHSNLSRHHHVSRKPEATPKNIPKALLLSPPLPIRRRPANILITSKGHLRSTSHVSTSRSLSSSHYDRNHLINGSQYNRTKSFSPNVGDESIKPQLPTRSKKTSHQFTSLVKRNEFNSEDVLCIENNRNIIINNNNNTTNNNNGNHSNSTDDHRINNHLDKEQYSRLTVTSRWNYLFIKLFSWFQRIQRSHSSQVSSPDCTSTLVNNNNNNDNSNNNNSQCYSSIHQHRIRKSGHMRSQSQPTQKLNKLKSNLHSEGYFNNQKRIPLNGMTSLSRNASLSDFEQINNFKCMELHNDFTPSHPHLSTSLVSDEKKSADSLTSFCQIDQCPIVFNNTLTTNSNNNNNNNSMCSNNVCVRNNTFTCKKYPCSCTLLSSKDLITPDDEVHDTCSIENDLNCFCSHSCPITSRMNDIHLDSQIPSSSCMSDCFCTNCLGYCDHCCCTVSSALNNNNNKCEDDHVVQCYPYPHPLVHHHHHCHHLTPHQQHYHHYYSCHHHHYHHRRLYHRTGQNNDNSNNNNNIPQHCNSSSHTKNIHHDHHHHDCTNCRTQKKAVRNFHLNLVESQYATLGRLDQVIRPNQSQTCSKKASPSSSSEQTDCSSPVITLHCLNTLTTTTTTPATGTATTKRLDRCNDTRSLVVVVGKNSTDCNYSTNKCIPTNLLLTDERQCEELIDSSLNERDKTKPLKVIPSKSFASGVDSDADKKSPGGSQQIKSKNDPELINRKFVSDLMHLKRTGWYWGPLSVEEAELLLKNCSNGTFLVRDSSHDSYMLSVSFRAGGQTYHTRIEHLAGKFSLAISNDLNGNNNNNNASSSVAECIERVMAESIQDRMHFLPMLNDSSPSNSVNNGIQLLQNQSNNQQPQQQQQPQQLTNSSHLLESTRRSTSTHIKASLLHPLSRFLIVPSLLHLCRFELLLHVRHDHIDLLPLPPNILRYLKESKYYAEIIPAYLDLLSNGNTVNKNSTLH